MRRGVALAMMLVTGSIAAGQVPDLPVLGGLIDEAGVPKSSLKESLDSNQTMSSLTARLRLLSGDLDPKLFKDIFEQFKNNKDLKPDDLLKSLGQNKANGAEDLAKLLKGDPSSFDLFKQLSGRSGPNAFNAQQWKDALKNLLDRPGSGFTPPKMDGNYTPPKIDLGNLGGTMPKIDGELTNFKPQGFQLPEGSPEFLKDFLNGWEKNVGSIDANPALKEALNGFLKDADGFNPGDLKKWMGDKGFDFTKMNGMFDKVPKNLKMPKLPDGPKNIKLPNWNGPSWGAPSAPSMPSAPSLGGWSLPSFGGGGAGAAVPVLILLALIAVAVLAWWMWPQLKESFGGKLAAPALALPEGFDPRGVKDRESLVKAFEVVSMLLCGPGAKVWNHATIATALRDYLAKDPDGIDRLAVMYAHARYTPAGESMAPESVAEARRTLCDLAGVPAA